MDGILIIDKPEGFTSFDVVAKMRGLLHTRKVGHAGTLDPMATGVLPILVERGTKCCDILPCQDKRYLATFQLGVLTDTLDSTGTVLETRPVSVSEEQVEEVLKDFEGEIDQIPPMYSAIQINGQRLYDLARQGIEVEREARKITIYHCRLVGKGQKDNEYVIDVACSKGTYIRTLCGDIGEKLGCGATMTALRRTEAAGFTLQESISLDEAKVLAAEGTLETRILPVEQVFRSLPKVQLNEKQSKMYRNGVRLDCARIAGQPKAGSDWRVFGFDGTFLGVAFVNEENALCSKQLFAINP